MAPVQHLWNVLPGENVGSPSQVDGLLAQRDILYFFPGRREKNVEILTLPLILSPSSLCLCFKLTFIGV